MSHQPSAISYQITIGWLYPDLMSTYGDRGNIIVLQKRCQWRGIKIDIKTIDFKTKRQEIESCHLLFGGGAQDRQQRILIDDLRKHKGPTVKTMIEKGIPGLFVCGSPQLLGHQYMTGDGKILEGLGIFDMVSKHFGKNKPRCIGNTISELCHPEEFYDEGSRDHEGGPSTCSACLGRPRDTVVGFENHGGRTYLGKGVKPFARVQRGFGNNGEDQTEGAVYKNCIATYSHGPFLPKNPHIADWLIQKALEVTYRKHIPLAPLDDTLEWQAHEYCMNRFL